MSISSRSRLSVVFTLAALVAFVGAFTVYGFTGKTAAHAASAISRYSGTLGKAHKVGTINVSSLLNKNAPKSNAKSGPHAMPLHPRPAGHIGTPTANKPTAQNSAMNGAYTLHNFDGVNAMQNGQATNGYDLEPPDEAMATDGHYVLNFVNLSGAIYTKNGATAAGPFPLGLVGGGGFFNVDLNNLISDPRAFYDKATHTWFALVLEDDLVNGQYGPAYIDLAVNSGNPVTSTWTIFKVDVTDANGSGCPCLPDFTILGVDAYNVYLLPNEFQNYGPGFNGSQIYVLAKSQLIAGDPTPNVVHFGGLSIGGSVVYHLQPANEYTAAPAEYFVNSLDPNSTFDNRLGVWAMTNRNNIAKGVIPNLSSMIIQSETYGNPVNAQTPPGYNTGFQQATTGVVSADFDAMQEVQFVNGYLYGALDTAITVPGVTSTLDGLAWFKIAPKLVNKHIGKGTAVAAQGYIARKGLYLLYPHIEASLSGTVAMTFSYGGPTTYLSAAYVVMQSGSKYFGGIRTAAAGSEPDNGFTGTAKFGGVGRWGDYSAGQLDPSGNGIWFATQYIPNNGDQYANWGNRIFEIPA